MDLGNCTTITYPANPWEDTYRPTTSTGFVTYWPPYYNAAPTECSGDIHVFPCPHCDKCKCGGATKAKAKR